MKFARWLKQLFSRRRLYSDLSEEIREHLEEKIEELVASGMSRKDATYAARREFGNLTLIENDSRQVWQWPSLESFFADVRYAIRTLRKSPGFTFVVIATLALGIGANSAIFSVLESQLWRPLPFPDSERLVDAHVVLRQNPRQWDVLSERVFQAWHSQSHSFQNLAATAYPMAMNLAAGGTSQRELVMPVGSNLFDTLEVPLERGRSFLPEEETAGRDHVAILSHALWQSHFSSDLNVLGKPVTLDGEPYMVVGIASPRLRFEYIDEPSIFVPLSEDPASPVRRNIYVIGRLAPGITPSGARAELDAILQSELKSEGAKLEDIAAVKNLRETWTTFAARPLYFFAGAVLLVLLIACVNNAGLLLARGLARQREFALRAALGAPRAALMRQSLVESLVLSFAGGAAGALLGYWGANAFAAFIPADTLPRNTQIALDSRVLLFVLGVSIFSALLVGIAPALFSCRVDLNVALRQGASGLSSGLQGQKTRVALVAVEIALALVLLFATSLFLSSFIRLEQAPRGFDAPGALSFRIALRGDNYSKPDQQQRYFRLLTEQLRALPGVRSVTLGSGIPLAGSPLFASVQVKGRPALHPYGTGIVVYSVASGYFDALHMHLLAGRAFSSHDTENSPRVAVINRNAVRTFFGSEDPLGKVLEFVPDPRRGVPPDPPVEIVGICENVHEFNANEVPFEVVYLPYPQHPVPAMYGVVSSSLPRGALLGAIRGVVYSLDRDQPIFNIQTMDDRISHSVGGARFDLLLVAILALVGLTLVSVGIFGTVSYFVRQRTQEFGIRLALGATPSRVLRHAISQSLAMGFAGLFFGIVASLFLARVLRSTLYLVPHEHSGMLYGVSIYDPFSMCFACLLLLAVLFLASFLPARRATQVDPMVALRYE